MNCFFSHSERINNHHKQFFLIMKNKHKKKKTLIFFFKYCNVSYKTLEENISAVAIWILFQQFQKYYPENVIFKYYYVSFFFFSFSFFTLRQKWPLAFHKEYFLNI